MATNATTDENNGATSVVEIDVEYYSANNDII